MTEKPEKLHIYSDSSSHRGHQFMVVGGAVVKATRISEINGKIEAIRSSAGMSSAFKWKEYRGGRKKPAYFELVRYFFKLIRDNHIHFHVMICPFVDFDHRRSGRGNQESSVNRMYFQLYLHRFCRFYGAQCHLYGFPDRGNDSFEVVSFRDVICAKSYKTYSTLPNCLKAIQPQASVDHNIIQMVDVVIGSIAALREQRNLNATKSELAAHILKSSGRPDWATDTKINAKKFSVWNFQIT